MRVLFVQPGADRQGHYGLYTLKLCQALAECGHEVCLWTNKADPGRYLPSAPRFQILEVQDGKLPFRRFDEELAERPLRYVYGYLRNSYSVFCSALSAAKQQGYEVIHGTGIEFMTASLLLKRFSGRIPPVVMEVSAANFAYSAYPGSIPRRIYKVLQREVFRTTLGKEIRALAVLGEFHRTELKKQLRLSQDFPITVIPDGGSVPEKQIEKSEARRLIGLEDYPGTIFLFFGLLRKDKGIEDLLDALPLLKSREFKLVIAGSPFEYTEGHLRTLIERTGAAERVVARFEFIPEDQVHLYFYACDALVLPYPRIYTGGSGPLLKGAAIHSRPAIVTNVSEMGRLVRAHEMGFVAEPENPRSLAEKMMAFMDLPEEARQRLGKSAFSVAKQNTWDAMAVKFTELYRMATAAD